MCRVRVLCVAHHHALAGSWCQRAGTTKPQPALPWPNQGRKTNRLPQTPLPLFVLFDLDLLHRDHGHDQAKMAACPFEDYVVALREHLESGAEADVIVTDTSVNIRLHTDGGTSQMSGTWG